MGKMKDRLSNDNGGIDTPVVTGVIVIGAVAALWAIRRGFRGVNLAGLSVGIK